MAFITYCLTALLCMSGSQVFGRRAYDEGARVQSMGGRRSCDLQAGTVCIPSACSVTECKLFSTAVCINDRCGCEARFFTQLASQQSFQDVTKMCAAGNAVLNFANYTAADTDATIQRDEDPLALLSFFKQFNLLVAEIMSDITDYLRTVTEARPTQANIDQLTDAIRTMHSLKRTSVRDTGNVTPYKDVEDIGNVTPYKDAEEAYPDQGMATSHQLLHDPESIEAAVKRFQQDAEVLTDVLSKTGKFANVVQSGKVAISDKGAQELLQEKGFLSGLGNLIKTGWNLVKKVAPVVAPVVEHVFGL